VYLKAVGLLWLIQLMRMMAAKAWMRNSPLILRQLTHQLTKYREIDGNRKKYKQIRVEDP
jgi:hypothetical protein